MNDDMVLVREYVTSQSDQAFEQLVTRHVNLVYSVALREVHDVHTAEELTQAVFILLARKAKTMGDHTILSAWLYRTTRYAASDARRKQDRRLRREQEAHMQSLFNDPPPDDSWNQIGPLLDSAIDTLNERDRSAIVLRYFDGKNMEEIGQAIGATSDAAKMRVSRALEKLRKYFGKRGITVSSAALVAAISTNSVHAAPAGLALSATAVAAHGAVVSTSTLTLIKGALNIMAWAKAKTAIAISIGVLLTAGTATSIAVYEAGKPMRTIRAEWTALAGNPEQWNLKNGEVIGHTVDGDSILASQEIYTNITFSALVASTNKEATLAVRLQDAYNGYFVVFRPPRTHNNPNAMIELNRRVDNHETTLATHRGRGLSAFNHSVKLTVVTRGPFIEVRLNGTSVMHVMDATFTSGHIGLRTYGWGDYPCDATFSNIKFE